MTFDQEHSEFEIRRNAVKRKIKGRLSNSSNSEQPTETKRNLEKKLSSLGSLGGPCSKKPPLILLLHESRRGLRDNRLDARARQAWEERNFQDSSWGLTRIKAKERSKTVYPEPGRFARNRGRMFELLELELLEWSQEQQLSPHKPGSGETQVGRNLRFTCSHFGALNTPVIRNCLESLKTVFTVLGSGHSLHMRDWPAGAKPRAPEANFAAFSLCE